MKSLDCNNIKIDRRKSLYSTLFSSGFIFIFTGIFPILFTPLIINKLGERTYGLWIIVLELANLNLLARAIHHLYSPRLIHCHSQKNFYELTKVYSCYIFFNFVSCIIYFIIALIFTFIVISNGKISDSSIKNYLNISSFMFSASLMYLSAAINLLVNAFYNLAICFQQPYYFNKINILYRLSIWPLIVILITLNIGIYAFPIAYLSSVSLFAFLAFKQIKSDENFNMLRYQLNWEDVKADFKVFSIALLNNLLYMIASSPSWIISILFSPQQSLYFKITQKIYELSIGFYSIYTESIGPSLAHYKATALQKNVKKYVYLLSYIYIILLSLTTFTAYKINHFFISTWVGSHFFLGNHENLLLCIQTIISLISNNINILNRYMGGYNLNIKLSSLESILSLALSLILTKFYGINGIILSFLTTSSIFLFINIKNLRKLLN